MNEKKGAGGQTFTSTGAVGSTREEGAFMEAAAIGNF